MPETILPFENEGRRKEELDIATDVFIQQVYKRANLPKLLAHAATAGYKEEALEALIAWGTGKKSIDDLWVEICPMTQENCVQGVTSVGKKKSTK